MTWQPINLTEQCATQSHLTACTSLGYIYLNLLTQLYGGSFDDRYQDFLRNENFYSYTSYNKYSLSAEDEEQQEYDFVVVGAGAAGCVLANRLTEVKKWKVLLLEAGPEQPDATLVPGLQPALVASSVDWDYRTQPAGANCLATDGCTLPRGKMMGGSTSLNGFVYNRGNRLDYDGWAAAGNGGWGYDDVLPYFRKSENNLNIKDLNPYYHGTEGEQPISRFRYYDSISKTLIKAYNEKGLPTIDANGAQQLGVMLSQGTTAGGIRVSANQAFVQPIRYSRENLIVKTNSEAVRILINKKKVAYGVKYVRNGKTYFARAKKEVIVSAGAIGSPKLLLLSGIGPKDHLNKLNIKVIKDAAVGENYQDHVSFNGLVLTWPNSTSENEDILKAILNYERDREGPLSNLGSTVIVAYTKTNADLPAPNLQAQVFTVPKWREYFQNPHKYLSVNIFPASYYDSIMPRMMFLEPNSRGRVLLNESDPFGPPVIYTNYFADKGDLKTLLVGVKSLLSLENTEVFKSLGLRYVRIRLPECKMFGWSTDEYFLCLSQYYTAPLHHLVGTCKMGPQTDGKAVVDPRLKVHGVKGLRVVDASVVPKIIRSNPLAAVYMIAEKGADMIKEDWLSNCTNLS